jgi:transposase
MKTSKIPPKEDLLPYVNNRKEAANVFNVTEKTIILWLIKYDLYKPKCNYGSNKLDIYKAREIRDHYKNGKSMKELAVDYDVTLSTISRIIHNINYHEDKEVAEVHMIYNPIMVPFIPKT